MPPTTAAPPPPLPALAELAAAAGRVVMEHYERAGLQVERKADDSPVTEADRASQRLLVAGLAEIVPGEPVVAEEGPVPAAGERRGWRRFWLVDPLDGTREFLAGNGEFTVNLARVEGTAPVLGVVHAPAQGTTWLAAAGAGAWRLEAGGEPVAIRATGSGGEPPLVLASRSHRRPELDRLLAALPPHRLVEMGSSLKLCRLAEGAADLYARFSRTMEWDTAAGHAVLAAAGGSVHTLDGAHLAYAKPGLDNPPFVAVGRRPMPWRRAAVAAGLADGSA